MTQGLYLIGGPGVGKSTVMRHLLADWDPGPYERLTKRELFGHYMLDSNLRLGLYLGHMRESYPGTDALSLSVSPQAVLWLQEGIDPKLEWVFGEGQRLGTAKFLPILDRYLDLVVVHLTLDPEVAAERRNRRVENGDTLRWHGLDKPVSEQSIRARFGAVRNAVQRLKDAGVLVLSVDASGPADEIADWIRVAVALG